MRNILCALGVLISVATYAATKPTTQPAPSTQPSRDLLGPLGFGEADDGSCINCHQPMEESRLLPLITGGSPEDSRLMSIHIEAAETNSKLSSEELSKIADWIRRFPVQPTAE